MKLASETYSIGVDLGGTNLRVASYAEGIDFLDSILIPTRLEEGRDQVVRDMCEAINALLAKEYSDRSLAGIGIGTPGPLELPEGILRNPPNLGGWDGFNLRHAVESTLGRSIDIESDANLAALAEQMLGAGRTHRVESLCVLTLGTGVGNGLILNGRIWHGSTGMGGEAGHVIIRDTDGAPCGCGGSGCLEQYASATAVLRMARERMGDAAPATSHDVALLARDGNLEAISVFETVGHALAIGLTGLINTLNLPLYLLGGGVCEAWDLFSPAMFRELHSRSYVYRLTQPTILEPERLERHKTYILGAQLGATAGLLGACLLPFQPQTITGSPEALLAHQ
ncbi:ROK family protein [Granulicella sibirica]|uniref:Glucokinase n=1 Tax=Granulicella sibirica TaxID=2479048 RepID=A0A4Q0T1M3_9BACT|nr:ROK family protein [Granulicella sibirica]RXH57545.1 Glucokinase [Granulicella sibirica]